MYRILGLLYVLELSFTMAFGEAQLDVQGMPQALIVTKATAGQEPDPVSDIQTSYSVSIDPDHEGIISGYLLERLAEHTVLTVQLVAPNEAVSLGAIALTQTSQTLVTHIPPGMYEYLPITYGYRALASAGVVPPTTLTLVLEVTQHKKDAP